MKYIISYCLIIIMGGCLRKNSEGPSRSEFKGELSDYLVGQVDLPLDSLTPIGREIHLSIIPESDTLIVVNKVYSSLDLFDLEGQRFLGRISLDPIMYHNFDLSGIIPLTSDVVVAINRFTLGQSLLISLSENSVKLADFSHEITAYEDLINSIITSTLPGMYFNNSLYFMSWPTGRITDGWQLSKLNILNLKTKRVEIVSLPMPAEYRHISPSDKLAILSEASFVLDETENRVLFSFPLSNSMGVIDLPSKRIEWLKIEDNDDYFE